MNQNAYVFIIVIAYKNKSVTRQIFSLGQKGVLYPVSSVLNAPFQTTFSPSVASVASAPPTAYNERVVAFLRQANVIDVLKERRPAMMANKSIREVWT